MARSNIRPMNAYIQSLRDERERVVGMLASLEHGNLFGADGRFNEARIRFTRKHLANLDVAIQAEESGYAQVIDPAEPLADVRSSSNRRR